MKKCPKCENDLDESEFRKNKTRKDGLSCYCKSCIKIYDKSCYGKGRLAKIANSGIKRRERAQQVKDYIKSLNIVCECGESHPACIDFHHINPNDKKREVSKMIHCNFALETIKAEIAKCKPMCSNCHRKLHYEEKQV